MKINVLILGIFGEGTIARKVPVGMGLLDSNWSGRGGQPGLALGEHDEGVEEVPAVFGGGGR